MSGWPLALLIRRLPALDVRWPEAVQERWWRVFARLMRRAWALDKGER